MPQDGKARLTFEFNAHSLPGTKPGVDVSMNVDARPPHGLIYWNMRDHVGEGADYKPQAVAFSMIEAAARALHRFLGAALSMYPEGQPADPDALKAWREG